ncbi:MAG: CinA family nicotinamide mononucleotide deamidase-related protein [Chloroflexi bacterium]|nr:CinA family nicotinamide mononucleotide deamidase-related protein [Chloroflexota bacterium]
MKAEIISVGTELLLGQITDTNASWLAQQLPPLGIDNYWVSAAGDNLGRLSEVIGRAFARSDLTIISGGLGPTEDDLTREAICAVLAEEMVVVPELERDLRAFFARRGVAMPERNIKQATLIPSALALANPIGTAPGWWVEKNGHVIVAMPGVPVEMRRMWQEEVVPHLCPRLGGAVILSKILKIIGLGESTVGEMIAPLLDSPNPTLATYAKSDGIHVRITAKAADVKQAQELIAVPEAEVRRLLGDTVYGVDDETLDVIVARLLEEHEFTIGTLEGFTGGLLSAALAAAPGSGVFFRGGGVVASAAAAATWGMRSLGPTEAALSSPQASRALALAARERLGTDIGIGLTGAIGLTNGQPWGTYHVAVDNRGTLLGETSEWRTTPAEVRRRAVLYGLALLRRSLLAR